jgi:hypothetical protein
MNKAIKAGLLFLCALALMGCLETVTLVRVAKDGSGVIEQSVIISSSFKELMLSFGGSEDDFNLLDEAELEAKAASFGPGVRYVSAEALETESGAGYKAVYAFDDITAVRINQNPGENLPTPDSGQQAEEPQGEFLGFGFQPGSTAWLTVRRPDMEPLDGDSPESGEAAEDAGSGSSEEIPDMIKDLYRDMRIEIALEVEGEIVETNATHAEGSRITYLALDFGKLLENEQTFTTLMESNPDSLEELKELLRDYPGIKMELQEEVRIGFK